MTEKVIRGVKTFQQEVDSVIIEIVKENENLVIQMNVQNLFAGIKNNGERIVPPYKPSTVKRKKRKGQPFDRVTTRDEGKHHESIFIKYKEDEFELDAEDFKKQYLIRKYGSELYGLTEENIERLKGIIKEKISFELRKRILL